MKIYFDINLLETLATVRMCEKPKVDKVASTLDGYYPWVIGNKHLCNRMMCTKHGITGVSTKAYDILHWNAFLLKAFHNSIINCVSFSII